MQPAFPPPGTQLAEPSSPPCATENRSQFQDDFQMLVTNLQAYTGVSPLGGQAPGSSSEAMGDLKMQGENSWAETWIVPNLKEEHHQSLPTCSSARDSSSLGHSLYTKAWVCPHSIFTSCLYIIFTFFTLLIFLTQGCTLTRVI